MPNSIDFALYSLHVRICGALRDWKDTTQETTNFLLFNATTNLGMLS